MSSNSSFDKVAIASEQPARRGGTVRRGGRLADPHPPLIQKVWLSHSPVVLVNSFGDGWTPVCLGHLCKFISDI